MTVITLTDTPEAPINWPLAGEMHFRLIEDNLGSLDVGCNQGYVVSQYDFGYPTIREVTYDNSLDDGTFDLTQFVGSRAVSLDIVLRPTEFINGGGLQFSPSKMRDALVAYTHPNRRPYLVFQEHLDDRVKRIQLRGASLSAPINNPRFNRLNVGWVAPLGLIESYILHFADVLFNEAAGIVEVPVCNAGTVGSHWKITISGEMKQPQISLNNDPSRTLELDYDATVGDVVEIDSFTKTVSINGAPVGYRYLNDNSNWFTIPAGCNEITITHDDQDRVGWPFARWEGAGYGWVDFAPDTWFSLNRLIENQGYAPSSLDTSSEVPVFEPFTPDILRITDSKGLASCIRVAGAIADPVVAESVSMLLQVPDGWEGTAGLYSNGGPGVESATALLLDDLTLRARRYDDAGDLIMSLEHVLPAEGTYHVGLSIGDEIGDFFYMMVNGVLVDSVEQTGAGLIPPPTGIGIPRIGGLSDFLVGDTVFLSTDEDDILLTDEGDELALVIGTDSGEITDDDNNIIDGTGIIIGEFMWAGHKAIDETFEKLHAGYMTAIEFGEDGPTTWAEDPPHDLPDGSAPPPPPWSWSTVIDPDTGEPGTTALTIEWRDTWI